MNNNEIIKKIAILEAELTQIRALLTESEFGTLDEIMSRTCHSFNTTREAITNERRHSVNVSARTAFCAAARSMGYSLHQIARAVKRDHTSVLYMSVNYNNRISNYPEHAERMESVTKPYAR